MGRGDRKTGKGKIFRGSFGKTRKHHPKGKDKVAAQPAPSHAPSASREKQRA